jgi:hypothetical protein
MRLFSRTAAWALPLALVAACGASQQASFGSTAPGAAAGTAAVAAAATVAVGCTFQGCPYGSYCDEVSKLCVAKTCGEGCPDGTVCNEGLNRCQAASPPNTPNDMLPQDRELENLPTMH